MYVEYKTNIKGAIKWVHGDYFKPNPYYNKKDPSSEAFERIELHGDRNYSLFTTLAGVRDYSEKVIPVSEPKGIPDDCSDYVKEQYGDWDCDGHTHSFLTLKEIRYYNLQNPFIQYTGLLSPEQIKELDENGKTPDHWCQGTNMPGYERREWQEKNDSLLPLIDKMQQRAHELLQYSWQEYDHKNDENIRIVFWFDN